MFSRCYPTISDLLYDLTGFDIPLPIFSYGFCLALGFLFAAWTLSLELKRREQAGWLHSFRQEIITGEKATPFELIVNALLGFLLGYKILFVLMHYRDFSDNPQGTLLSSEGNWIGGIALGAALAYWKYHSRKKEQLDTPVKKTIEVHPHEVVGDITIVAAVSGIIGAKLFYFFETPGNFTEFLRDPFGSFFGGLTVYGGLILGTLSVLWFVKKRGMNPIQVADAAAPGLFLAYAFGRQGCQLSGDGDWGIVNTAAKPGWLSWLPDRLWAFDYPHNIINDGVLIPGCQEAHCHVLQATVFPTPMYESFTAIVLFALLWALRKRFTVPGILFSTYFILNGIQRYFIEGIRVNTRFDFLGMHMSQAEIIAIIYVLVGIAGIIYFRRSKPALQ